MGTLKPCYCGNFGDDGADDACDRACEKEALSQQRALALTTEMSTILHGEWGRTDEDEEYFKRVTELIENFWYT